MLLEGQGCTVPACPAHHPPPATATAELPQQTTSAGDMAGAEQAQRERRQGEAGMECGEVLMHHADSYQRMNAEVGRCVSDVWGGACACVRVDGVINAHCTFVEQVQSVCILKIMPSAHMQYIHYMLM
jgi:hypothetical protein